MNFCHFLTSDFMKAYRQWLHCKHNSLYNFNPLFMQLCTSFFHGLKICMWFGFNPAINFCHFSTLLTLSFFSFSQVRHQLHRSSIYIYLLMCKTISQIVDRATKNLILIDVINYISDACTKKRVPTFFCCFHIIFIPNPPKTV